MSFEIVYLKGIQDVFKETLSRTTEKQWYIQFVYYGK